MQSPSQGEERPSGLRRRRPRWFRTTWWLLIALVSIAGLWVWWQQLSNDELNFVGRWRPRVWQPWFDEIRFNPDRTYEVWSYDTGQPRLTTWGTWRVVGGVLRLRADFDYSSLRVYLSNLLDGSIDSEESIISADLHRIVLREFDGSTQELLRLEGEDTAEDAVSSLQ